MGIPFNEVYFMYYLNLPTTYILCARIIPTTKIQIIYRRKLKYKHFWNINLCLYADLSNVVLKQNRNVSKVIIYITRHDTICLFLFYGALNNYLKQDLRLTVYLLA